MELSQQTLDENFITEFERMFDRIYTPEVAIGRPDADFNWPMYQAIEDMDALVLTTARVDGVLAGVAIYVCIPHPHYRTTSFAECDSLLVNMDYRGQSIGKRLYKYTEDVLRERGVTYIANRHRLSYGEKSIFPGLGFRAEEVVYTKEL